MGGGEGKQGLLEEMGGGEGKHGVLEEWGVLEEMALMFGGLQMAAMRMLWGGGLKIAGWGGGL